MSKTKFILRKAPGNDEWSVYALYDETVKAREDLEYLREHVTNVEYKLVREL